MHQPMTLSALLVFLAAVNAQTPGFNPFITPKPNQDIKAGANFDIIWEPAGAPEGATVSIKLLQGTSPQTLQTGTNVGSKIPSKAGHYKWAVPRSIKDSKVFGFAMYLDGKEEIFQYSPPFDIDNLDNDDDDRNQPSNGKPLKFPTHPGEKHDDDKDDKDDHDDYDDDDHDDYKHGPPKVIAPPPNGMNPPPPKGMTPPAGPDKDYKKPPAAEPIPDLKYNNGTHKTPPPVAPHPKPSAVMPPAAYPSAPAAKPKPVTVINGASHLALNGLTLLGVVAVYLAL